MSASLVTLHPLLRPLGQQTVPRIQATGYPRLDAALHERGWPLGALIELLPRVSGQAELRLLAPALRATLERPGWLVLVTPPGLPHAPAWAAAGIPVARVLVVRPESPRDWLWAVDQAARAGQPAVLAWPGRVGLDGKSLRRLQLAAEEGGGLLVVSRRPGRAEEPSPAALRVVLHSTHAHLQLKIMKQRGHWGGQSLSLPLPYPETPPPSPAMWLSARIANATDDSATTPPAFISRRTTTAD
ncbi:MAG TPA: translesion DNA synthesis-associated protein ImuA [Moraxellaceae bacterium]|nr:translesion DNA synthesis-associated protein ImuA [Moraxellaceae bacterium]